MLRLETSPMFSFQQFSLFQWVKKLSVPVRDGGKTNIDMVTWEEEGLGHSGIFTTTTFRQEIVQHVEGSK